MQGVISNLDADPMGRMILDYLDGDARAQVSVYSPHLEMAEMTGAMMCRSFHGMGKMEQRALALCRGRILDVGAGSGCHSLYLQEKGEEVTALDISPGCVAAMERRGVKHVLQESVFHLTGRHYDTLLMLMNGIGLCGNLEGLNRFFEILPTLLAPGGQVVTDSTNLAVYACDDQQMPWEEDPEGWGAWETRFSVSYGDIRGEGFDWLYLDAKTLFYYANRHGFACNLIFQGQDGEFLVQMVRKI